MTRQSPRLRILLRRPNPRLTSAFIPLLGSSGMLPRMRAPALALSFVLPLLAAAVPGALPAPVAGSDHGDSRRARQAVRAGVFVPLERIVADAQRRHPGRVLEVDLDGDEYEIEILRADGTKVELEYDARSGALRDEEEDD